MDIKIPDNVKSIMSYLEDSGFEVFAVGGCVRDFLLGKIPNDWDMCTNATPDEMITVLKDKYTVIPTGLKHGTVTVILDNEPYEITTYRTENGYLDNRHPDKVEFVSDIKDDLKRRDFTVNAMAYNQKNGLIDLYSGKDDLVNKIIRCVGNPAERFNEDALRILRAVRFSAKLSFDIEENTSNEILNLKDTLNSVSKERIFAELKGILSAEKPYMVIEKYKPVFELILCDDIVVENILDKLPANVWLRLSALLYKCDYKKVLTTLKADNKTKKAVSEIIENKDISLPKDKISSKKYLNKFGYNKDILIFSKILNNIFDEEYYKCISLIDSIVSNNECFCLGQLKISGTDLVKYGYKGKEIKEKLEELLWLVIEEKAENEKDELIKHT